HQTPPGRGEAPAAGSRRPGLCRGRACRGLPSRGGRPGHRPARPPESHSPHAHHAGTDAPALRGPRSHDGPRLAKELRDWKESGTTPVSSSASVVMTRYECPVDLAMPFAPDVISRARELGLAEAHTVPIAEIAATREAFYTHAWQPSPP